MIHSHHKNPEEILTFLIHWRFCVKCTQTHSFCMLFLPFLDILHAPRQFQNFYYNLNSTTLGNTRYLHDTSNLQGDTHTY